MAATTASPCLCGALRKATRAVTRRPLHDKGWIAIRTGRDRRERMLSITAAGRALLAEAEPLWLATQQRMSHELGARWDILVRSLREVTESAAP